jgi:cell division protein FtsW
MGQSSFVNQKRQPVSQARPKLPKRPADLLKGIDWILVGVVTGLTLFGLLMVYSAGPKFAMAINQEPAFFLQRQVMWAIVGLGAVIFLSLFDYHYYQRLTVVMLFVTIIALLAVAILGDTTLGANRSLFSGSIRPSELAKIVAILYISVWLNSKREVLNDITLGLVPLMLILGITGGLILIQPDLSAAITVIALGGILFFLAGGEWRQIGLTLAVTVLIGWIVVNVYPTGIKRITEYLAGLHNPLNASYHVQRSLEAIIKGKFLGVGIGLSSTKFTGLPVAPTDSIFAVIAEETGLLGAGVVILAYIFLLWRGLLIARRAPDMLGGLLASGITIWIVFEALLNMAVMVNLLPQAGNALPFISYGGSNLLVTLAGVGILLNIARISKASNSSQGGMGFGSVVDLRWRDRRRRVSRYGHSSGSEQ